MASQARRRQGRTARRRTILQATNRKKKLQSEAERKVSILSPMTFVDISKMKNVSMELPRMIRAIAGIR